MTLICHLILFVLASGASGQTLDPPFQGTPTISTWYGPRIHPTGQRFQFHNGVDYPQPLGTPAQAIEDGTVQTITPPDTVGSGYVFSYQGTSGHWSYLHIFVNGSPP